MDQSDRLVAHLWKADHAVKTAKEAALRRLGVTVAQQSALSMLHTSPGITAAELARRFSVTPQTMTSLVNRLESRGLVERNPHPIHGTLIEIRLTEQGRALWEKADALLAELDADLRRDMDESEVGVLIDLLSRVTTAASGRSR